MSPLYLLYFKIGRFNYFNLSVQDNFLYIISLHAFELFLFNLLMKALHLCNNNYILQKLLILISLYLRKRLCHVFVHQITTLPPWYVSDVQKGWDISYIHVSGISLCWKPWANIVGKQFKINRHLPIAICYY